MAEWTKERREAQSLRMKQVIAAKKHKRKRLTPSKRALKAARFRATMAARRAARAESATADFNSRDEIHGPKDGPQNFVDLISAATDKRKLELVRMILDL